MAYTHKKQHTIYILQKYVIWKHMAKSYEKYYQHKENETRSKAENLIITHASSL